MAGFNGQFGYITETTTGTAETVDKFLPVTSVGLARAIQQLTSSGIRAGRRTRATSKQGQQEISGTVETELWNADVASLFKHLFGSVSTATNGAQWDYTYTPADLSGLSMTVQTGIPDSGNTVRPFTYAGVKVNSWTLSANVGEIAMLSMDMVCQTETNGTALESASYDSGLEPFVFTEASVKIAGTTNDTVRSFTLTGANSLESRFRLGSGFSKEYLEGQFRDYTGTISLDFNDLTEYTRFVDGDQAAVVLTFDNGTESLVVTMNVRYDGETPSLSADTLIEQPLPFTCISATNDAGAITAVLTAGDGLTGAA